MNRLFDKLPVVGEKIPGKITLSFLMLILAVIMELTFKTSDRLICVFAMFLSFIGDIALNHNRDHTKQSKKDFLLGGITFIVAHIFYCIAYYKKITVNNYTIFNVGSVFAVILLLAITVIIFLKMFLTQKECNSLFWFGIVYLWLTGINYTTIFSYAYSIKSIESLSAFGGILFLASDVIIGLEKFLGLKSTIARELVWWFYPIGQIILIIMA